MALKKKQVQAKKKAEKTPPPPEDTGRSIFPEYILKSIDNHVVRDLQNRDGRCDVQLVQDIGSKTAANLMEDVAIQSNPRVCRSLQQVVPRTTNVKWRGGTDAVGDAGTPNVLSVTQARRL